MKKDTKHKYYEYVKNVGLKKTKSAESIARRHVENIIREEKKNESKR